MKKKELGDFGENIAKKFLIDKGFEFVTENYFTRYGEIDLIFKLNTILIFIEVKTRKNKDDLDISISHKKVQNIYKSADIFIEKENVSFSEVRFDVIFITMNKQEHTVEIGHRPNFF